MVRIRAGNKRERVVERVRCTDGGQGVLRLRVQPSAEERERGRRREGRGLGSGPGSERGGPRTWAGQECGCPVSAHASHLAAWPDAGGRGLGAAVCKRLASRPQHRVGRVRSGSGGKQSTQYSVPDRHLT